MIFFLIDKFAASTYTFNANQGVGTIPSAWAVDSIPSQSQNYAIHKDNYSGPTPTFDDYVSKLL
jgi:hypothetical protein